MQESISQYKNECSEAVTAMNVQSAEMKGHLKEAAAFRKQAEEFIKKAQVATLKADKNKANLKVHTDKLVKIKNKSQLANKSLNEIDAKLKNLIQEQKEALMAEFNAL